MEAELVETNVEAVAEETTVASIASESMVALSPTTAAMEDIVIVESKDYAQVIFDDVKECYTENRSLECFFTLSDLLRADSADWIGIYKVGFTTSKDHVCLMSIDLESIVDNKGKLTFTADSLPKDDGEFYQFVYVSQAKQIRGASIPFQFKRTHFTDLVEVEEQETVVIKSKENAINETINEMKMRCASLCQTNDLYEKLIKENEDLINRLKEDVSSFKLRCFRLTMENEKLHYVLKSKAESLKVLADNVGILTSENEKLQGRCETLANENNNLVESLQHRIDQVAQLKSELERLKSEKISTLENHVDLRVQELTQIKEDLKKNEAVVSEQAQTIENMLRERDSLNNLLQKLTKDKNTLECNHENLSQELNMSKDKLLAAEQCKEMLRAQLVVATNELNEANVKLSDYVGQIKDFLVKEEKLEAEKTELIEKMKQMKSEYELKLEQVNGSYYALRLAHVHLETRLKATDQKREKTEKDLDAQKQAIERLQQENVELKERIHAGAKEYSKLFEKYRLLKNRQFNYDMNVYHDLNGDVHLARDMNSRLRLGNYQQPFQYRHSTPTEEQEADSALQDKTVSQSARAHSVEMENSLLDALLGSSLYNNNWNGNNVNNEPLEFSASPQRSRQMLMNIFGGKQHQYQQQPLLTQPQQQTIPNGLPQSRSQMQMSTEMSDDGLVRMQQQQQQGRNGDGSTELKRSQSSFQPVSQVDNVFVEPITARLSKESGAEKRTRSVETANVTSCEICNYIFPTESVEEDIIKHHQTHYGPTCPVCFTVFYKGYSQDEFEKHVNTHFTN